MRLEDLKNESPSMPDEIREMIEQEVKAQISNENATKDIKHIEIASRRKRRLPKVAAIALIATLMLGTTVFAAVKYFQWKLEKKGNYGATITAMQPEETAEKELHVLSIEPKWLPKGMVQDEELKFSFEENRWKGGISISTMLMDRELSESKSLLARNVINSETMQIANHESIYLEKDGGGFNKRIYMALPEYGRIIECFGGDDLSKEDMIKILENLEIMETDEVLNTEFLPRFSDLASGSDEASAAGDEEDELFKCDKVYKVGEPFEVEDNLQATVKSVELYDDFSVLDSAYVDSDLMEAVGEDGNLKPVTVRYMKSGDGVNTLDEEIESEEVGQKLAYVTVEYKNTGDETMKDILYRVKFDSLVGTGNKYSFYNRALAKGNPDIDIYSSNRGSYGFSDMNYFDVRGGDRGNNYISELKPGETVTVHAANVIYEDEADKLFLTLASDGSLQSGIVDAGLR